MWLSLMSVALGSLVTLTQYFGLNYLLSGHDFLSARAAINSMNLLAPFLCIGLDNAAPRLAQSGNTGSYVWGFLVHAMFGSVALVLFGLAVMQWKYAPFAVGAGFALTLSASLVASNYLRAQGAHRRYFLGVNVYDRLARTIILLGAAAVSADFMFWVLLVIPGFIIYSTSVAIRSKASFSGSFQFPKKEISSSLPLILSSVAIIFLTRSPYFASYMADGLVAANSTDLILLFSLFIMIPVLNLQKIGEVDLKGISEFEHLQQGKRLFIAEYLVVTGFIGISILGYIAGLLSQSDIGTIAVPVGIGMIIASLLPNFPHLLLLLGRTKDGLAVTIIAMAMVITSYFLAALAGFAIAWGFALGAAAYTLIGVFYVRRHSAFDLSRGRILRTFVLSGYLTITLSYAIQFDFSKISNFWFLLNIFKINI